MSKPVKKIKYGAVDCAIWCNDRKIGDQVVKSLSASFQKTYQDKDGNWKQTDSFDMNSLPKLLFCVQEAYRAMVLEREALTSVQEPEKGDA